MSWAVSHESDEHFHVQGDRELFRVSKAGLSPAGIERMRKMAGGGKVKPALSGKTDTVGTEARMSDGGTPPELLAAPDARDYIPPPDYTKGEGLSTDTNVDGGPLQTILLGVDRAGVDETTDTDVDDGPLRTPQPGSDAAAGQKAGYEVTEGSPSPEFKGKTGFMQSKYQTDMNRYLEDRDKAVNALSSQNIGNAGRALEDKISSAFPAKPLGAEQKELVARGLAEAPAPVANATAPADPATAAAPPADTATPAAPVPPPAGYQQQLYDAGSSAESDAGSGVDAAAQKTAAEQVKLGQVQQTNASAIAAKQQAAASDQRKWMGIAQQRQAASQVALDKMFQDYQNQKVDPNHFWSEKSTGSKIAMGISLFLGGIGSGLSGQPNAAAQFVQHSIQQDIEAQKANSNRKGSVLGYYMKKMGDDRAAEMMTHSVLSTIAASELDAQATRAGGSQAAQAAKVTAAQYLTSAKTLAAQATNLQTDTQMKQEQLKQLQINHAMMRDMMNGQGQGQTSEGSRYVPSANAPRFTGDPAAFIKDARDRRIDWQDASGQRNYSHGKTEVSSRETQGQLNDIGMVRADIVKMKKLAEQASLPGSLVPWSAVRAQWDALQGHMAASSVSALEGVHRLNDRELDIGKAESGQSIYKNKLQGGAALNTTLGLIQQRQDTLLRGQGLDERYLGRGGMQSPGPVTAPPRKQPR